MDRSERACEPSRRSAAFTVDEDEDEVADSRTDGRPARCVRCGSSWCCALGNFLLVTGGRLRVGLVCLLNGAFAGVPMPGDADDMEVGVEVRLKAPGDSDRRVDEPLSWAKVGVGGGRFCVNNAWGVARVL